MATNYEDLLPEILPMVPGCPDTLVETTIRAAVIELCEKAAVYQRELDTVTTVANIYEYDLEPPSSTVVHSILWVTFDGEHIEPISTTLLEQRKPKWRDSSYYGTPEYFIKVSQSQFWLVPVPDVTKVGSTVVRVQLKPTYTSTACDSEVMTDYRDTIINGTLFRLLRMPGKDWSDLTTAQGYGVLFSSGVELADRKANHDDMPVARKVKYGGVFRSYRLQRNRYGRETR